MSKKTAAKSVPIAPDAAQVFALNTSISAAKVLLDELKQFLRAKGWPGVAKRPKGQDDNESGENLSQYGGQAAPGQDDVSDPSTAAEETGSDDPLHDFNTYNAGLPRNRWVPHWCNPKYRDVRRIKAAVAVHLSGLVQKTITVRRDFPILGMRPALLAKDQARNPTTYAKRFGIEPDVKPDGRSRFSPTISATRRVLVENSQNTGTQQYVGMEELDNACRHGIDSLLDDIDASDPTDTDHDTLMALKVLLEGIADDHAYQRAVLQAITTDERRGLQIHDADDPDMVPDSDLEGPLHPLLTIVRWAKTKRYNNNFTLYYDFAPDNYGEWTVHDQNQRAWMALQPVLQLMSRIISIHPVYHSIWDVTIRRLVAQHRIAPIPEQTDPLQPPRYIHQDDDTRPLLRCHASVRDLNKIPGFKLPSKIYELLRERLEWIIHETADRTKAGGTGGEAYGVTTTHPDPNANPNILITIPPMNLWPLMHPEYTKAEKGVLARFLAAVMLHELAHASNSAVFTFMRPDYINSRPDLDARGKRLLMDLCQELFPQGNNWYGGWIKEPWMNDEATAELGFTAENQIFGGALANSVWWHPLLAHATINDLMFIQPALERWPHPVLNYPADAQSCGEVGPITLKEPRLPIDRYLKLATVHEQVKLFQQQFWDAQVAKFGLSALLLYADGESRITVTEFTHRPIEEIEKVLGKDTGGSLEIAISMLSQAGYGVTANWLDVLFIETSAQALEVERWVNYFERRPAIDARLQKFQMLFNLLKDDMTYIEAEGQPAAQRVEWVNKKIPFSPVSTWREYQDQLDESKDRVKRTIIQRGRDFHVSLLAELEDAQVLVLKIFTNPKKVRVAISNRFLQPFKTQVADKYTNMLNGIRTVILNLFNVIKNINLHNSPDFKDLMDHIPDFLQALAMTSNSFDDVYRRFEYRESAVQGVDDPVPQFTAVASRKAFRHARFFEQAALREIYKMPKLVRTIVDKAVDLLLFHAKKSQGTMDIRTDLQRMAKAIKAAKARDIDLTFDRDIDYSGYNDIVDLYRSLKPPPPPAPISTYFTPALDPDAMDLDSDEDLSDEDAMDIDPPSPSSSSKPSPTRTPTPPPLPPTPTPPPPVTFQLPKGSSEDYIKALFGGGKILEAMATNNWAYHTGPSPPGKPTQVFTLTPIAPPTTAPPTTQPPGTVPRPSRPRQKKGRFDRSWEPSSSSLPSPSLSSDSPTHRRTSKKGKMRGTAAAMTKQDKVKSGSRSKKRVMVHDQDDEWRPTGLETSSDDSLEDDSGDRRRMRKRARRVLN